MPLSHRSAAAAQALTAPDANIGSEPAAGAARIVNAADADDYIERRSPVSPAPGIVEGRRAVMSLDEVSTLARSVDIEEAAARMGVTLKRVSSREMAGPCPACGGVDRFSINPAKGVFNCRGSGGGDVITMVRHCLGLDFRAACEWVTGERAGAHRYEPRPRRAIVDAPKRPGVAARVVNAGAKMHRRAGAKMHQAAWSEGRAGAAFRGWAIRLLVSLPAECRRGLARRGVCSA